MKFIYIIIGGGIGALLRYIFSGITYRFINDITFPYGTLIVNLLGALIIGFLWGIFQETIVSANIKTFIFIGILGAFTTFSTYALETFNLLRDGEYKYATANILITNILGILLLIVGIFLSKYIILFLNRR